MDGRREGGSRQGASSAGDSINEFSAYPAGHGEWSPKPSGRGCPSCWQRSPARVQGFRPKLRVL